MNNIEKGFLLVISTWENDLDNSDKAILSGLSENDVRFLIPFINLFESSHYNEDGKIGNAYDPNDEETRKIDKIVAKFLEENLKLLENQESKIKSYFFKEDGSRYEELADSWCNLAYDLSLAGGEYYTRVLDNFELYFISEPLKNLSDKFR